MAEVLAKTASQWVDAIDIGGDKKADITNTETQLKKTLKGDLQILWARKTEGRITDAEYNRYANTAKTILEKGNMGLLDIRKEYMKERNKTLKNSNNLMEDLSLGVRNSMRGVRNIATDKIVQLQQKYISEDTVQGYSETEGNYLIDIKEFEKQLKTRPIEEINGLALKSYFAYLQKHSLLNRVYLEQKFNGPDRLLQLSILWGTKFTKEVHVRGKNGDDKGKALVDMKTWLSGTSEKKIGNEIFKEVIVENIKKSGLEKSLFDGKKYKNENGDILDKKLDKMSYEAIIKEFKDEFKDGKITGEMVRKYFARKVVEGEKEVKKLEIQQKEAVGNKTVGAVFAGCDVVEGTALEKLKDKKMSTLTPNEKKMVVEVATVGTGVVGITIGLVAKVYIDKQVEIDARKQGVQDMKHLAGGSSSEALAKTQNNGGSPKKLTTVVEGVVKVGRSEDKILSKEALYKETLEKIGYPHMKIVDICKNKKLLTEVLSNLEKGNLKETELYKDLKPHLLLKEKEVDNYVMATENITSEQLAEQKKQGRRIDTFAEEIYKEDTKQKKTTNFTVIEQPSDQRGVNVNNIGTKDITARLSMLHDDGEYIPLKKIGDDTCFVAKDSSGYILSINGKTEVCSNEREVKKTIDSYSFFYDMGLKSIASSMQSFLAIVKSSDSTYPEFDVQKGFGEQQQAILLRVVDMIFDLNMEPKMAAKNTKAIIPDFTRLLHTIDQKNGFDAGLRKKGILTEQGRFHEEGLKQVLIAKKNILTT